MSARVHGQGTSLLDRKVTLSSNSIRLDTLLQTITRQTGVRFSYNSRRLNSSYRLKVPAKTLTVRKALDELKLTTGVLYTLIESQVVLNIEKSTVQRPVNSGQKSTALQAQPTQQDIAPRVAVPAVATDRPPDNVVVSTVSALPANHSTLEIQSPSKITDNAAQDSIPAPDTQPAITSTPKVDSAQKKPTKPAANKTPRPKKYFIDAGISVEETLFMGATLQGGLPKIFGSVSLKSNGQSMLFLYGIGTSIQVKKQSRVLISAQYGTYTETFINKAMSQDTVIGTHTIGVKGFLARAGIGIEWKVKPKSNWKIYAGLNFNVLQSRYTVDEKDSGLEDLSVSDPERKFSAFYPFYTLTNNYEDAGSPKLKTWIGGQLGISYTIFTR